MEIYEALKADHRQVKKLMEEINDTTERALKTREEKFAKLKQELTAHSEAEDEVFYNRIVDEDETRDIVLEGKEEHGLVTQLLEELGAMAPDSEEWTAKFTVLKENVEHHVEEEEGEMFKKAREVLSSEQAVALAEEFESAKAALA